MTDIRNNMTLSGRLMMSASMVTKGARVADIGCDHAHTCIWLVKQGISSHCIGMDVRTGPLEKAMANIELYGCAREIELRLSDGLEYLKPGEADEVIIAGMGGRLIADILDAAFEKRSTQDCPLSRGMALILQPQTHHEAVRGWLDSHGYVIVREDMCVEDGKYYVTMRAELKEDTEAKALTACREETFTAGSPDKLTPEEIYFGPCLIREKHPVLKELIEIEYRKKKYMLGEIKKSGTAQAEEKYREVEGIFNLISNVRDIINQEVN